MRLFCDLHIHSCLSPCGDELMTPNNIAGMAMLKGLDAIAVADHNCARNLPALAKTCAAMGVLLLPAMELTTAEEAHLLSYFPTVEAALEFSEEIHAYLPPIPNRPDLFGAQQVLNEDDEPAGVEDTLLLSALSLSLDELVGRINARGGAAVPAHINRGNNGLLNVLGFLPPGLDIAAVEVWRALPCALDVSALRVLHSSDAHYLENMLEREVSYEVAEKSVEALFAYIKSGAC
ncbi:MAG TPA: PHP domain-containing protein [Candidatus Pullichristensenella avicola]|nr:PHP domain-containing protein [Candidatus Pullichristensenella avicola]